MNLSNDNSVVVGNKIKIDCDCLGISGGWTPRVHLFTQSGGKLKFRDKKLSNIYWLKYVTSETISRGRKLLSASAPNLIQTVWFLKIIG